MYAYSISTHEHTRAHTIAKESCLSMLKCLCCLFDFISFYFSFVRSISSSSSSLFVCLLLLSSVLNYALIWTGLKSAHINWFFFSFFLSCFCCCGSCLPLYWSLFCYNVCTVPHQNLHITCIFGACPNVIHTETDMHTRALHTYIGCSIQLMQSLKFCRFSKFEFSFNSSALNRQPLIQDFVC